jgi:hypothetical protein
MCGMNENPIAHLNSQSDHTIVTAAQLATTMLQSIELHPVAAPAVLGAADQNQEPDGML